MLEYQTLHVIIKPLGHALKVENSPGCLLQAGVTPKVAAQHSSAAESITWACTQEWGLFQAGVTPKVAAQHSFSRRRRGVCLEDKADVRHLPEE